MQVHYKGPLDSDTSGAIMRYTGAKPRYKAGMLVLQRVRQLLVFPGVKNFIADVNCEVCLVPVRIFFLI